VNNKCEIKKSHGSGWQDIGVESEQEEQEEFDIRFYKTRLLRGFSTADRNN